MLELRRRGLLSDDVGEDGSGLAAPAGDEPVALDETRKDGSGGDDYADGVLDQRGALHVLTHARAIDRHLSVGCAGFTALTRGPVARGTSRTARSSR